jgi:hypothetical protein
VLRNENVQALQGFVQLPTNEIIKKCDDRFVCLLVSIRCLPGLMLFVVTAREWLNVFQAGLVALQQGCGNTSTKGTANPLRFHCYFYSDLFSFAIMFGDRTDSETDKQGVLQFDMEYFEAYLLDCDDISRSIGTHLKLLQCPLVLTVVFGLLICPYSEHIMGRRVSYSLQEPEAECSQPGIITERVWC